MKTFVIIVLVLHSMGAFIQCGKYLSGNQNTEAWFAFVIGVATLLALLTETELR